MAQLEQSIRDSIEWEYGQGHLVHGDYDPYDPFSILDGHGALEVEESENLTPILIRQAAIYPEGRMLSIALKGIEAEQTILKLP